MSILVRGKIPGAWRIAAISHNQIPRLQCAVGKPALAAAVEPLLKAREALERQIADLDRKVLRLARSEPPVRRFMTVAGVGPITALCYLATIDDPARFKKSRNVRAYVGLTTHDTRRAKMIGRAAYPNAATGCCEAICTKRPMCC